MLKIRYGKILLFYFYFRIRPKRAIPVNSEADIQKIDQMKIEDENEMEEKFKTPLKSVKKLPTTKKSTAKKPSNIKLNNTNSGLLFTPNSKSERSSSVTTLSSTKKPPKAPQLKIYEDQSDNNEDNNDFKTPKSKPVRNSSSSIKKPSATPLRRSARN